MTALANTFGNRLDGTAHPPTDLPACLRDRAYPPGSSRCRRPSDPGGSMGGLARGNGPGPRAGE